MSYVQVISTIAETSAKGTGHSVRNKRIMDCRSRTVRNLVLSLIICVFVLAPGASASSTLPGWMFHADPAHTGIYGDNGIQPVGTLRWSHGTNGPVSSSPAVANGVVYVGSNDNRIYALYAANGSVIWDFSTNDDVTSSPAVVNGVVYVGSNDNQVYALDAANGSRIWDFSTNDDVTSSPAVVNGVVYVGSNDKRVYALDAANGSRIWDFSTNGNVQSSPAVANGVVYVGSNDKQVYALNGANGSRIWDFSTNGNVQSSPAVANGVVYVGSNDKQVYALNAANGSRIWDFSTNDDVTSSPAVANGVVYVGSNDNQVYALGHMPPVPAFSGTPTSGDPPLTVTFSDSSTGTITGWHWDFGDGTTSTDQNPAHTYPGPGKYTVNLTVTGPGETASLVKPDYISVNGDFSGSPRSGALPLAVNFSDTLPADTTSRHWDFGDGSTSTLRNPMHTYNTSGGFTVTLNATGPGWSTSLKKENFINTFILPNPVMRWKFRTNIASASPLVTDNGILYIDGGKTLYAVDTRTGTERWHFITDANFTISELYHRTVYGYAGKSLYAVDAGTGVEKWRYNAPDGLGRPSRFQNFICFNSGKAIIAVDSDTGKEKWRFAGSFPFGQVLIGSGIVAGDCYAGAGTTFYAIDTIKGKEKWHTGLGDEVSHPASESVYDIFVWSGSGHKDPVLYSISKTNGSVRWKSTYTYNSANFSPPTMMNGVLYFDASTVKTLGSTTQRVVTAIEPETGTKKWMHVETGYYIGDNDVGMRLADGVVYLYGGDLRTALLIAMDAKTGNTLWANNCNDAWYISASPVIENGVLYTGTRDDDYLFAFDAKTGTTRWVKFTIFVGGDAGPFIDQLLIAGGVLYARNSNGYLYAIGNPISFSATPVEGPVPLSVAFSDTTPQQTSNWNWNFGDGSMSTLQNPVHIYTGPGDFDVTFTATDASGIISVQKSYFIHTRINLTVTSVTPVEGVKGTTIPMTVTGSNFTADTTVTLTNGAVAIPVSDVVIVNSTTITFTAAIPSNAPIGLYDLTVTRGPDSQKLRGSFRVLAYPAPVAEALAPATSVAKTLQKFTLTGSNFKLGATVIFTRSAGDRITTTAITNNQSEIVLTATFPESGVGIWNLTVTNPDSGAGTLANAVTVTPSNAPPGPPTEFTLIAFAGANGTISPDGTMVVDVGANQTFVITADPGYRVADVIVDDTSVGAVTSYTFDVIDDDHAIGASFIPVANEQFAINATAGVNGNISPNGTVMVDAGTNQTFVITADSGFRIDEVLVDGASVGAVTGYTFTNVSSNHTIDATFSTLPEGNFTIEAIAGSHGRIDPSGVVRVASGADQTFTITPDTGYNISTVIIDGISYGNPETFTFTDVADNHTIIAYFSQGSEVTFPVEFQEGWNIFSTPIALEQHHRTVGEVFGNAALDEIELIYGWDGSEWFIPPASYEIQPLSALYVKARSPVGIAITPSTQATMPPVEKLPHGFSLIGPAPGYTPETGTFPAMPLDQALVTIKELPGKTTGYVSVISPGLNQPGWTYVSGEAIRDLLPFKGYWVYMVNDGQYAGFSTTPIQ